MGVKKESSSEDSSSEEEAPKKNATPKKAAPAKKAAPKKKESSSEESSSFEEKEEAPKKKAPAKKAEAKKAEAKKEESSSSSGESSSEEEMETDAPKKRAKETNGGPAAKKAKEEEEEEEEEDKDKRTLFVRNLPFSVDEDQMYELFNNYGTCQVRLLTDRNTGKPKGIGFVEYEKVKEMKAAIADGDNLYVGDRQALVKCAADPKPEGRQSFGNDRGGRRGGRQSFGGERQERNDEATVFVKNLPWSATQDSVWEMFGNNVKNVRLPTDRETGRMKGFGYVEFNSVDGAKTASKGNYALDGRDLTVNMAGDRPSFGGTPR